MSGLSEQADGGKVPGLLVKGGARSGRRRKKKSYFEGVHEVWNCGIRRERATAELQAEEKS